MAPECPVDVMERDLLIKHGPHCEFPDGHEIHCSDSSEGPNRQMALVPHSQLMCI